MRSFLPLLAVLLTLASCQPKHAPLIGISCGRSEGDLERLPHSYVTAITRAGGLPVILPTVSDEAVAAGLIRRLDGVVFSGGPDFDPALYGEEVWNQTVSIDSVRDCSDLILARTALKSGKPVLGICRGHQLLNVALGGSLIQDIPTQAPDSLVRHGGTRHPIAVEKGSALYRLFGKDTLIVNSFHHQAVRRSGEGIKITARSTDGIVEAFEYPNVLAVQFHPEKMIDDEPQWLAFFEEFVNRCQR